MAKNIHIEVTEEQFERLTAFKDERGYTWKGLLLEGYRVLDTDGI